MKSLVVLVLLLSGLGWGYARTKSSARSVHWRGQGGSSSELATNDGKTQTTPTKLSYAVEHQGRAVAGLTDPVLLMFFGGLMFLMSWVCVAWASWRERKVAPVWERADGDILAEAG